MPLSEAVWLQFAMQLFEGAVSTPIGGMGRCWYYRVAVGQATDLPFSRNVCNVTDRRQTDGRPIVP